MTKNSNMAASIRSILGLAVFGGLLWLDSSASASCTVRFEVTADLPSDSSTRGIGCTGPWVRQSSCGSVSPGDQNKQFYCADQTTFSLNGHWTCQVYTDDTCNFAKTPPIDTIFVVSHEKPNSVVLTVGEDSDGNNTITNNVSSTCDCIESGAALGDYGSTKADRDTWRVPAEFGEIFRIRVEANGASGHTGEMVRVKVKSDHGRPIARDQGPVPLELDAVAEGPELEIIVMSGNRTPFRGDYRLIVTSDLAVNDRMLEPQNDVEF